MSKTISVITGPNLNLLGKREPSIYGKETLEEVVTALTKHAQKRGYAIEAHQSNSEGALVDAIQNAAKNCCGIIINGAAYSHTSIALRDAITTVGLPTVEVHFSNVYAREEFRRHSYLSEVAVGVICGFGGNGYVLAFDALYGVLEK